VPVRDSALVLGGASDSRWRLKGGLNCRGRARPGVCRTAKGGRVRDLILGRVWDQWEGAGECGPGRGDGKRGGESRVTGV